MVRPSAALVTVPPVPEGYRLRGLAAGEEPLYAELFQRVFDDPGRLPEMAHKTLPGGCVVVEHLASRRLAASCRAYRARGSQRHRDAGQLAWLLVDPDHRKKGLGTLVAATVTNRLVAEYRRRFLRTEDSRIPAISLYLRLAWEPNAATPETRERWKRIFSALGRDFSREAKVP